MAALFNRLAGALLALALAAPGARADTPIVLFQTFAGNVNFAGTQVTLRDRDNKKPCSVFGSDTWRRATLSGIPAGATILGAHLYWAGSAYNPDYTVTMKTAAGGTETIAAGSDRRYYTTAGGNGSASGTNFFGGAADLTAQVRRQRNGDYEFKGLTVQNGAPYCAVEAVLGGFSLLVVYSEPKEPFRVLNIYEGFQFIRYSGFTLNLSNFRIPADDSRGRIAHVTWEGDATLDQGGENLSFNGIQLSDGMNHKGNQFNSKSSINGDDRSYGIDFDAYTLGRDVLNAGDTSATTSYQSGQDMVLLNAEVVAVPNSPAADLAISKVRANEMVPGQNVVYTITVQNSGPYPASGVTSVIDDLPPGLTAGSAAGSGWSCSGGQRISCTTSAQAAVGASLPPLTVTARVSAPGTYTNTAMVTGGLFDHNTANNSSSATGTAATPRAASYIFTDAACVAGKAFGSEGQTCSTALPAVTAGGQHAVYITALVDGVPAALNPGKDSAVSMQFALSCHNPASNAGVSAEYAGVALPLCASNGTVPGTWSGVTAITVPAGQPSAAATFRYNDVGQVQLYMKAGTSDPDGSVPFVSAPHEIRLTQPGGADFPALPASDDGPVFRNAGRPFAMAAGAYTAGGQLAPNFGREAVPAAFAVPAVGPGAASAAGRAAMTSFPALEGGFGAASGGRATGTAFSWPEVGIITLTPALAAGSYLDVPVMARPTILGRFIPDRFSTAVTPPMDCAPGMGCEVQLAGAAYSGQPFDVAVAARNAAGGITLNYHGPFARGVTLSAYGEAGGIPPNPAGGTLGGQATAAASAFIAGQASMAPKYSLPNPWLHSAPLARNWSAPASVYVRAQETGGDGVTSNRPSGAEEGGLRIASGRLLVPNAHGSERLGLPLKLVAQFWSGSSWDTSSTDSASTIDPAPARVAFSACTGALDLGGGACRSGALSLEPQGLQALQSGAASIRLKAPGYSGSADLVTSQQAWLPSTRGRLRFGVHKSPLIYVREGY